MNRSPLAAFLERGTLVLDGGLATTLESKGCDLDDPLWSARVLLDAPQRIGEVHREFLEAGADCIATATYQATLPGFRQRGLSDEEGIALMRSAVEQACSVRDRFWSDEGHRTGRLRPLVAGSIGPYGAYLADGSEYVGRYGLDSGELESFHRQRWELLAASEVDLLACETIPSFPEAQALLRLLDETPARWAWLSFSCRDEVRISDGTPFVDAVKLCDGHARVAAVGVNCTPPALISPLIRIARDHTDSPVVVYPNSGERYDARSKSWAPGEPTEAWADRAAEWIELGAAVVGGCCRTGPGEIAALRRLADA
ncbi:MAG: homocysteine S-methyltransferase [Acidobacteria bacterium]|nr:homocysteine S-methyltransferase [Acidobacteriota bacterium]NIM61545.1 homocysteine S-methyltransferase [Acidobacteriota bacterium]NIO60556.1 homocysteine S-methyltransferase [Acidobacteriota bacterium]NIQ31663.1 homocysteine S-methyltransferase [Acidobacteriota bacterium]NIQ86902.1 homocysteine S-methyltransferase [Acidobacteriota bacterium]